MTIRAEIEGGDVLEFPDGTSDEVIQRVVQQTIAQRRSPGTGQAPPMPTATGNLLPRIGRQLGLAGRYLVEGPAQIPLMLGNAASGVANLGIRGVNALTGGALERRDLSGSITGENGTVPQFGRPSDAVESLLNRIAPQPENATERVVGRMSRGVGTLMGGMGLAQAAAPLGPTSAAFSQFVNTSPGAQLSAVTGMDAGGGVAREVAPDSPITELLAATAGGVAGYGAHQAGRYGIGLARAIAEPFHRTGQERIVADTMRRFATRPGQLGQALSENVDEIIPGSLRTTAEVAGDPGMLAAQRTVQGIDPRVRGEFALRDATRNVARRSALDSISSPIPMQEAGNTLQGLLARARQATAADVSRMYRAVDPAAGSFPAQTIYADVARVANDMYARSTTGTPAVLRPILQRLQSSGTLSLGDIQAMSRELGDIAGTASQAGNNTLASTARQMAQAIMGHADDIAANQGNLLPEQLAQLQAASRARAAQGATFEEGAVGRAIDTNRFGRTTMAPENVPSTVLGGPTAARQLVAAAGNNPAAMNAARGAFVQELRQAIQMSTPDAMSNPNLSAAQFSRFMAENRDTAQQLFGREHMSLLDRIARDFTSRQMVDTVGRAPGSDTVQNLSVSNLIARMTGGAVSPTGMERIPGSPVLNRVLGWAYGSADNAMREMLADAMLNPQLARAMLARATPENVENFARLLQASGRATQPFFPAAASGASRPRERTQ